MGLREYILLALGIPAILLFIWGMRLQWREFRQDQQEEAEFNAWSDSRGISRLPKKGER